MPALYEKYRPLTVADFIGQDKVKRQLSAILGRAGWDRDAFFLTGPSGLGKTSLAWIIAKDLGAHDMDVIELDGDKCSVEAVRQLEYTLNLTSLWGKWKVVIVNEAHAMTARAVQAWLTLLERLPRHRLVIFTTTEPLEADLFGNFSGPFGRRCKVFAFTNQGLAQLFAARAREIADLEGLNGQPPARYLRLVQDTKNNMGAVLQRIEMGEMMA